MTRQTGKEKKAQRGESGTASQPSPVDPGPDGFARFMAAFPAREGGHDAAAALAAWERAAARASPEAIIAGARAYAAATAGRPRRYVMGARRWLDEGRWRETALKFEGCAFHQLVGLSPVATNFVGTHAPLVWIEQGKPEWWAWARFRGRTPPLDRRGGWRFPTRWPPKLQAAE